MPCSLRPIIALLPLTLVGCGDVRRASTPNVDPAKAQVVYEFNDAPIAPEYRRSYTVTVTAGSVQVVVDANGVELHNETKPIDAALWHDTLAQALAFASAPDVTSDGCVGDSSEELIVTAGSGESVVDVFIDNCDTSGGAPISTAVGDVLALFDMDRLLATD